MPREDKEIEEEERRAKSAYDLIRLRLNRLEKNIDKPAPLPARREAPKPKPPPEFVRNVVGSSAAAGSAEFHIFRNNRRKELNRLEYIEREAVRTELDDAYDQRATERREAAEARTAKRRIKRQRRKERLQSKKAKKSAGANQSSSSDSDDDSDSGSDREENAPPTDQAVEPARITTGDEPAAAKSAD